MKIPQKIFKAGVYLFLLMALFNQSCEYNSTETFNNKVNKDVPPPGIEVVDLNIEQDTLYVYTSKTVRYKFRSSNQKIAVCRVFLNDEKKQATRSNSGEFKIDYLTLEEGTYELTIKVFTEAGTGSIADELGFEGYVFSKSWVVIVDHSYLDKMKHKVEDGFLKISWPTYHASDFMEYHLFKYIPFNNDILLDATQSTHYIDSSYAGESAEYYVKVKIGEDRFFHWGELSI